MLTPSLEDYLETIYLLQQGSELARVRDIATARDVKASSVSPALKQLAELGYLEYEQRKFIRLTETGKVAARRVYARHVLLFQFFHDILGMNEEQAREEACGLEHALSDEGMERFVRFFESRSACPHQGACMGGSNSQISQSDPCSACRHRVNQQQLLLSAVPENTEVTVCQVKAEGNDRKTILEMGILPNVVLKRVKTHGDKVTIEIDAHEMTLTEAQTQVIVVTL